MAGEPEGRDRLKNGLLLAVVALLFPLLLLIGIPVFLLVMGYQEAAFRLSSEAREVARLVKKGFEGHGDLVLIFQMGNERRRFARSMNQVTYEQWKSMPDTDSMEGVPGVLSRRAWRFLAFERSDTPEGHTTG